MWKLLLCRWISHEKLMFSIKHSAAVLNISVNHMKRTMLWLIQRSGEWRLLTQPRHFLLCCAAHWSDWLKTHQPTLPPPLLSPPTNTPTTPERELTSLKNSLLMLFHTSSTLPTFATLLFRKSQTANFTQATKSMISPLTLSRVQKEEKNH